VPDRVIGEGAVVEGTEFGLIALHTPGHAPNHLCFLLEEERVLFTGDMILGDMYSVVNPARGGDMAAYLASLERLRKRRIARLCPGHGDVMDDARERIEQFIAHRVDRERQILKVLKQGPMRIAEIVSVVYGDAELHPALVGAAGWQVHAHLLKLKTEGKVLGASVKSVWKLA
jgi:glyoxylase-like metal-dependent hydrolase (beta-lactamase superfamily II)